MMERREFLATLLAAVPGVMISQQGKANYRDRLGELLPQRILGRTGESVTMLGVGGFHIGWTTERDAQETIETALEGGVRFFDTAESYQEGLSEQRYGKFLTPQYRDIIFLMTKTTGRDTATVQKHLDDSLRRLKTDYLDLWQIHSIGSPDDVDHRLEQGVLDFIIKAKESGKVRYIGFTGHRNPSAHQRMLERTASANPFDTCQMPVNVLDSNYHSFIKGVIPTLQERNIGLLAMKTLADGRFFPIKRRLEDIQWQTDKPVIPDRLSVQDALNFVWSLPASVLITGAENAPFIKEKISFARNFEEMNHERRQALIEKVADLATDGKVEYFKEVI